MRRRNSLNLVTLLAALGAAVAIWLSLGAVGVTAPDTARRVGVFAPAWTLLLLLLLSVVVWIGTSFRLRHAHPSSSLVWLPAALLSLPWLPFVLPASCLLWVGPCAWPIWAAIVVSVVGSVVVPAVGSVVGAPVVRGAQPAAAASACGATSASAPVARVRAIADPARAPLIAGVVAAAVYLFAGWQVSPWLPAGDEPHYLVIADSLLRDGDLRIENNHRAHDYLRYIDGELKPDYLRRGADGQIYSIHAPGLPVLLLPAYALFGYPGAVAFLALLSAAGSALAWHLCFTLTRRADAAWFGWAAAALPVPALFHAFTIYPDGAGAVFVLTGAAALIHADRLRPPRAFLHGAALACLPWLHTRFVLIAAVLGLAIVARLARRSASEPSAESSPLSAPSPPSVPSALPSTAPVAPVAPVAAPAVSAASVASATAAASLASVAASARAATLRTIAAFLAVPAVSAVAWFAFFYAIYGTPDPSAPYGTYTQSALAHVPAGVTGLLFDQQFGAIANAPVYLVGLCGLAWLVFRSGPAGGRERRLAIELLAVIVPYALAAAMYRMWWGGWSAPARFLAAVLPLLALPAALLWARARTQATKGSAIAALGVSVWLSGILLMVSRGRLAYNDRDGFARWAEWANPVLDLASGLPSLFQTPLATSRISPAFGRAAIWLAALMVTWAILRAIERARRRLSFAAVTVGYGIAAMAALSLCWTGANVSGLRPPVSQAALLSQIYAGQGELGVRYDGDSWLLRPSVMRAGAVPAALRLESVTRPVPRERPLFFMPRVPAGRYRLDLQMTGISPSTPEGRLDVFVGRSGTPLRSFDLGAMLMDGQSPAPTANQSPLELLLPIDVDSLSIRADERACRRVERIALVPQVAFDPRSGLPPAGNPLDRFPGAVALQTVRYGEATTVYATGPAIYLEPGGFWVQPRVEVAVLIEAQAPPTQFSVLVRNGPVDNRVRLAVEGWQKDVPLKAGEETLVDVPASRRGATPLRVYAAEGFRPSAIDPNNGDHRRLGAWIELR